MKIGWKADGKTEREGEKMVGGRKERDHREGGSAWAAEREMEMREM